jgi:hypothetical protein
MYMIGGGLLRRSELVTIKYKNSANSDNWGISIEDRAVVVIIKYYKNIGQIGKGKVIHRYLLREVGELIIYYL